MPGPDDLIYLAQIDDQDIERFFNEFDRRIDQMTQTAEDGFARVDESVKKVGPTMGVLGGVIGGLTAVAARFGLRLINNIGNIIKDTTLLTARVDTLGRTLQIVGGNAGYTAEELQEYEDALKASGITTRVARQNLQQMIQANLDLAQAADLARVAQNAAVIAGTNSSETFQRVLHAVLTLQPEILRTLNLAINTSQAYSMFAKELGKNVKNLTVAEKRQAFLNATMEAGTRIAGSYEGAMETVGKQLTSTPRYLEELQLAFGRTFQPILTELVFELNDGLKDMRKFLEDNEDTLVALGSVGAEALSGLIDLMRGLINLAAKLPSLVVNISIELAKIIGALAGISPEEIESRTSKLGTYFAQAVSLIAGTVRFAVEGIVDIFNVSKDNFLALIDLIKTGDIDAFVQRVGDPIERLNTLLEENVDAANQTTKRWAELTGVLKEAEQAVDATGDSMQELSDDTAAFEASIAKIEEKLSNFARKIQRDYEDLAIQRTRRAIEQEIRLSYRLEDIARNHAQRIRSIMEGEAQSRRDAAKRHAQRLIDIERDYRRTLLQIRRDFEDQADEAARRRDAIGFLRAQRDAERRVREAKIGRDESIRDAKDAFEEQLKEIKEQTRERLKLAERARQQEVEALMRSIERQRELQALHDQWEEEDRQRRYARQLEDMARQFQDMEGVTNQGLRDLLGQWEQFFRGLLPVVTQYMQDLLRAAWPRDIGPGGRRRRRSGAPEYPGEDQGVGGQGGQVSQLLSSIPEISGRSFNQTEFMVPQLPIVSPRPSVSRRELDVTVKAENMDPHIQRMLVRGLLEVERNSGNN